MMISVWILAAMITLGRSAVMEKRELETSYSEFEPSALIDSNGLELEAESRQDISPKSGTSKKGLKKGDEEDPQGSLYYYYYPSSSPSEEREDSAGSYTYYDPIESESNSQGAVSTGGSSYAVPPVGGGGSSYDVPDIGGGSSYTSIGSMFGETESAGGKDKKHFMKIAVPLFILGGLLLGLSSLTFGITKRSYSAPTFMEKLEMDIDQLFNVYLKMMESEQCTQKILCEAGNYAKHYSILQYMAPVLDNFMSNKMIHKTGIFKNSLLGKMDMKTCQKYRCSQ